MNPVKRVAGLLCFLALASPGSAQDMSDRAREVLRSMDPATNLLTDQTLRNTLTPYETDAPPEANLSPEDFEDEELRRRTNGSVEGGAYAAQADSAFSRPDVDLGADPLSLADDAIETAAQTVGGYFSQAGGRCTSSFIGGEYSGTQFCTRILARAINYCQEWREITVDRRDLWQCAVERATYRQQCRRATRYTCSGVQGGACIRQLVTVSGAAATWNDAGTQAVLVLPAISRSSCGISDRTVTLTIPSSVQLTRLAATRGRYNGVLQVSLNGEVIATTRDGTVDSNLPADATLTIANRDCGKDCAIPAVYAGQSWLEDCNDTRHAGPLGLDLTEAQAGRVLTPETPITDGPVPVSGSAARLRLRILTANTAETPTRITVSFAGSCCSQISASLGDQC